MHGYCPFPPPLYAGKKNFLDAPSPLLPSPSFIFYIGRNGNVLEAPFSIPFPKNQKETARKTRSAEDERRAHRAAAPAEADVQVDELPFQHHAAA